MDIPVKKIDGTPGRTARIPGTNAEIAEFCSATYGVTFPMFEKISVVGPDAHRFYRELIAARPAAKEKPSADFRARLGLHGITPNAPPDILRNFEKVLIGRNGAVVERFAPDVTADDPLLLAATRFLETVAAVADPAPSSASAEHGFPEGAT